MTVTLLPGDCLAVLRTLPDASVDACVTDPPAGIAFMGRDWDHDKGGRTAWVAWMTAVMTEVHRVLKPGGHAFVWALPRTAHWTATALEDAGLEIRDKVYHLFGSGFPKSLAVDKAIDKAAGAERETVGMHPYAARRPNGNAWANAGFNHHDQPGITAPATDLAAQWAGWGTALKPAAEEWILARKPLAGTVAATVAQYGTGAIHVDACRVDGPGGKKWETPRGGIWSTDPDATAAMIDNPAGRWPPNVLLQHSAACRPVGRLQQGENAPRNRVNVPIIHDALDADTLSSEQGINTLIAGAGPGAVMQVGNVKLDHGIVVRQEEIHHVSASLPLDDILVNQSNSPRPQALGHDALRRGNGDSATPRISGGTVSGEFSGVALSADDLAGNRTEDPTISAGQPTRLNLHREAANRTGTGNAGSGISRPEHIGTLPGAGSTPPHAESCIGDAVVSPTNGASSGVPGHDVSPSVHYTTPEPSMQTVAAWVCAPGCPVAALDAQSGERGLSKKGSNNGTARGLFGLKNTENTNGAMGYGDTGGASRFYPVFTPDPPASFLYCAKASKRDRTSNGTVENKHCCVKPQKLMEWLCTLITPPDGTVLDPFMGSGSTGVAAVTLGYSFIGCEQDAAYLAIAAARIAHAQALQPAAIQVPLLQEAS